MRIKLLVLAVLALTFLCCSRRASDPEIERGRTAIARYGCGSCHTIPASRALAGS